ncbi:MAG: hypothetical protein H6577_13905 [Lewinellaceae bacterium]|nr:hypothetical protein [Saprospiraceae bacterium]MCB9339221.1 hypothetical protein [Lewinellaceae bacterium]
MDLKHTLDLGLFPSADWEQKFKSLIFEKKFVVFVVVGNDDKSKWLVQTADVFANGAPQGVERKVIWVPENTTLKTHLHNLLSTSANYHPDDYPRMNAFTISPQKHEVKYLFYTDSTYMPLHVSLGYWWASQPEEVS